MTAFNRGDIVRTTNKTTGEVKRYMVVSPKRFNALGQTMVAPIQQSGDCSRYQGFIVVLAKPHVMLTEGVVLVCGLTTLQLDKLNAEFVEAASHDIVGDVLAIAVAIIEG